MCVFVFVFLCRKKPYARVPGHFHSIRFPPPFRSQVDAWRTDERLGAGKDHHNKDQTKDRRDVDTLSTHESQKNQPKKYHHACIYIIHNSTNSSLSSLFYHFPFFPIIFPPRHSSSPPIIIVTPMTLHLLSHESNHEFYPVCDESALVFLFDDDEPEEVKRQRRGRSCE